MFRQRFVSLPVILIGILAGTTAGAEVYRWVDEFGEVHYSDKPEMGQQVELLDIQSRPTDTARVAAQRAAAQETNDARQTRYDREGEAADEDARIAQEVAEERAENCEKAKARNQTVQESHRLYRPTESGEREYLSDEELDAARIQAARDVDEWCS